MVMCMWQKGGLQCIQDDSVVCARKQDRSAKGRISEREDRKTTIMIQRETCIHPASVGFGDYIVRIGNIVNSMLLCQILDKAQNFIFFHNSSWFSSHEQDTLCTYIISILLPLRTRVSEECIDIDLMRTVTAIKCNK